MNHCQRCNKELETELDDHDIETVNCIFHFCLDCNMEIEEMIEDKTIYYSNGERK